MGLSFLEFYIQKVTLDRRMWRFGVCTNPGGVYTYPPPFQKRGQPKEHRLMRQ